MNSLIKTVFSFAVAVVVFIPMFAVSAQAPYYPPGSAADVIAENVTPGYGNVSNNSRTAVQQKNPDADIAPQESSALYDLIGVDASQPLEIIILITVLSVAPSLLLMMTSYLRIIIVFGFLRNAMQTQSTPPNQVLAGLALFLTVYVMSPIFAEINKEAYQPYSRGETDTLEAVKAASVPMKRFMLKQTSNKNMSFFLSLADMTIYNGNRGTPADGELVKEYRANQPNTGSFGGSGNTGNSGIDSANAGNRQAAGNGGNDVNSGGDSNNSNGANFLQDDFLESGFIPPEASSEPSVTMPAATVQTRLPYGKVSAVRLSAAAGVYEPPNVGQGLDPDVAGTGAGAAVPPNPAESASEQDAAEPPEPPASEIESGADLVERGYLVPVTIGDDTVLYDYRDQLGFEVVVPAYMISELSRAFQMGFLLFVPFLIIDIVVSCSLMAMGMMMLPPAMISLPFKIMMFVLADGWQLIVQSIVSSINY